MANEPETFLRFETVRERTGLGRSLLYQLMAAGTFPTPVALTPKLKAWVGSEVAAWVAEQIATRDADDSLRAAPEELEKFRKRLNRRRADALSPESTSNLENEHDL